MINKAKKEVFDDKDGFWINAITKELNYRQRIIGQIKVEDGEIISHLSTLQTAKELNSSSKKDCFSCIGCRLFKFTNGDQSIDCKCYEKRSPS